ncbi:unnamed protein product [Bemisia tabaci]|uniref:Elongation factor 1-gamma n=1 Tax=Bemisia tabaci TaxID=7038 RepID=A0A9P0ABE7_BEMTA|nr:PREDICTED: elongation factor 1-gamma [Bemisia tabaci]CAH0388196.1 unnamed protein product [Bemisia tabaci]
MVAGTLYTYPENYRAYKALIAAQYAGANVTVAPNFVFGETNKSEAFLKKFPLGKVPAFETSDGKYITESNAIAYYVSNDQLRGKNDFDKAQVLKWLSFADNEIIPPASSWAYPYMGIMLFNKQVVTKAKSDLGALLQYLNNYLLTRTYLVGERITLADIVVACSLLNVYKYVLDPEFRKSYGNVNRWFATIINQPQVKKVVGNFVLCSKAPEVPELKKAGGKQEKAPKEKKQPEKKEKEPAEEPDACEAALLAEPKSKDPFDALPAGTFNFEDFKRFYSNNPEEKSIPYFWEKFDKQNYSIWFGEYKFNDELTKTFMSCNLITGMYQRLDKMRKQAFASVCLFGKDSDSSISGVWVWRGHDLAFTLSPDWQIDYESYDWKKLDADSAETKKLVEDYFSWKGTDKQGRPFNQGKIFK